MLEENLRNLGYRSYAPGRMIGQVFIYLFLHRQARGRDIRACGVQTGKKINHGRGLGPFPEQLG